MNQVSAGENLTETVPARRKRMRAQALGLRPAPPRPAEFQTPQWLDTSFVLPLTAPEAVDVPSQAVPHHDDDEAELVESPMPESRAEGPLAFVRPPTREVDFARVMRRSDLSRTSARTVISSGGMAGLVLVVYLLTSWPVVLGMAIAFGLIAIAAAGVRIHLALARLPYLDR